MDKELANHAADVLRAVAHPIRLRVIELLEEGELCVGAISAALDEKQAITSQQLTIMKDKGILTSRREGTKVFYRLENENVTQVLSCVYNHCQAKKKRGRR